MWDTRYICHAIPSYCTVNMFSTFEAISLRDQNWVVFFFLVSPFRILELEDSSLNIVADVNQPLLFVLLQGFYMEFGIGSNLTFGVVL